MRDVINISLPKPLSNIVDKAVIKGAYASKSEFFRHLLRLWTTAEDLGKSRKELEERKGKLLRSLKDLR